MDGWLDGWLPTIKGSLGCQGRIRAALNTLGEEQHFVPCSSWGRGAEGHNQWVIVLLGTDHNCLERPLGKGRSR